MKKFTPKTSNLPPVTDILNSIQNLFDTNKQNKTVAKFAKHEIKRFRVAARNDRKKAAFTLAEVLITIGVIGVVVAMVIPTLHAKAQKIVLKSQIKKAMSIIEQNYKTTLEEVGAVSDGVDAFSYGDFNTTFLNNFKLAKICKGNGLKDKCVPKYEGLNGTEYFSESKIYNNQTIYVTLDGMIMILYFPTWRSLWLVDVNGMAGPNKAGYDLFAVTLDNIFTASTQPRPFWSSNAREADARNIKGAIHSSDINFKVLNNW